MTSVAILGASGYAGGELLRLLIQHPSVDVVHATSSQFEGKPVHQAHPNLRGFTDLRFSARDAPHDAEVVFTCTPHGDAVPIVRTARDEGRTVIDLSADFRLRDPVAYQEWYGEPHGDPGLLATATYGLPEANRDGLAGARLISGVGCMATSMNLALLPLARAGLLNDARVIADTKIGSSAAGIDATPASAHPARSRSLRLYAPTKHRHAAEVQQVCGVTPEISAHSVELVRGILATCHVLLPEDAPDDKELWRTYRAAYNDEHFVRLVKERRGVHRGPDPKLVAGSNFADVGFHSEGSRIVATCAIDNLVKGAAGSAIQSMNLALGLSEVEGLGHIPVHPQ